MSCSHNVYLDIQGNKFGINQVIVIIFPMFNHGCRLSDTMMGSSLKAKIRVKIKCVGHLKSSTAYII